MRQTAAALIAVLLTCGTTGIVAAGEGVTGMGSTHVEKTFLIPAADGYGTGECLTGGKSECGQVVANAWCESQGFATAASYGVADRDEYTGAIETTVVQTERPVRITCQD